MIRLLLLPLIWVLINIGAAALLIRLTKWRKGRVKLLFFVINVALIFCVVGIFRMLTHPSPKWLKQQTLALLTKSGGINEVYKEADQIFKKFRVTEWYWFNESDLKPFPAIVSLGEVDYIQPEGAYNCAYIMITVHPFNNPYWIYISDTNSTKNFISNSGIYEVTNSIYVGK